MDPWMPFPRGLPGGLYTVFLHESVLKNLYSLYATHRKKIFLQDEFVGQALGSSSANAAVKVSNRMREAGVGDKGEPG